HRSIERDTLLRHSVLTLARFLRLAGGPLLVGLGVACRSHHRWISIDCRVSGPKSHFLEQALDPLQPLVAFDREVERLGLQACVAGGLEMASRGGGRGTG